MVLRRRKTKLLSKFKELRRKRGENPFANFSFKTISSLASTREGKIRSYLKLLKIRFAGVPQEKVFKQKHMHSTGIFPMKALIIAVLIFGTGILLYCQPPFVENIVGNINVAKVESVEFVGLSRQAENILYRQAGVVRYQTSMFEVDVDHVAAELKKLSWVDTATVTREWPSTVKVVIQEQIPVALVHTPEEEAEFYYINKKGAFYRAVGEGDDLDYPVITGLGGLDSKQFKSGLDDALLFLKKVSANNPNLPVHAVSEIHVDMQGELTVYLVDTTFPIYLGTRSIEESYTFLVRVLEDIYRKRSHGTSLANIGYIQLDYMKDQVLVAESGSG